MKNNGLDCSWIKILKRNLFMKNHNLFSQNKGIILAADVKNLIDLQNLLKISNYFIEVVGIKIGFTLALKYGLNTVVNKIREFTDIPIIYDHQKAGTDIPAMGKIFAETCKDAGIQGVIIFPHAGPQTLEAFVSAIFLREMEPIVGLIMTHEKFLHSEGGFINDSSPNEICKIALDIGVRNFVLPGTKLNFTEKFANEQFATYAPLSIMMPGFGTQGGTIKDALKSTEIHNRYCIIGSAIYRAENKQKAIKEFVDEINS